MSLVKILAIIALVMGSTNVLAEEDDESFVGYDSIVNELKASSEYDEPVTDANAWEDVALHAGAGIVTTYVRLTSPEGQYGAGLMKGIEAHLGANIFTRQARAELLFRNYAEEPLSSTLAADLKEFELRLVYLPYVQDKMHLRVAGGFSARYMDVSTRTASGTKEHSISTPATALMIGFERKVSPTLSVGPDVTYRSAMVSDTFDKSAWDASINLNATF